MLHQYVIVWIAQESYLKHDFVVQSTIYASHHTDLEKKKYEIMVARRTQ